MGGSDSRFQSCVRRSDPAAGSEPREVCADDFIIERVLGKGAYGVVVLVRMKMAKGKSKDNFSSNSGSSVMTSRTGSSTGVVRYAMKMQNTEARSRRTALTDVLPSRATSANRERDIMKDLDHPFIIRLAYFFELPSDRDWKDTSTGKPVVDSNGNNHFHAAIVMEFVSGGDLETYVFKHSPPAGGKTSRQQQIEKANEALQAEKGNKRKSQKEEKPQEPIAPSKEQQVQDGLLTDEGVDWIRYMRRFAAEMCAGLNFLHGKKIIYRDLKPQNVLLKPGEDEELHICFTDFGFSKQLGAEAASMTDRLTTLAGTPLYAAPEVMRISQTRQREDYTPSVDLYSLGRTVLVCLGRTRLMDHPEELKMPLPEQFMTDPRVPEAARHFVMRLTNEEPSERGTSDTLDSSPFFADFELSGVSGSHNFPAIDWAALEKI